MSDDYSGRTSFFKKILYCLLILAFPHLSLKSRPTTFFPATDTIPPPSGPITLVGPDAACVGETTLYFSDVPVACFSQWTIDGIIQPDTANELNVTWMSDGLHVVSLEYVCGDTTTLPDSILVRVSEIPVQPGPIQGPSQVCRLSTATYTTTVGPFDTCTWTVNGTVQSAISPAMTYSFGPPGPYLITVSNRNRCGQGAAVSLPVIAVSPPEVTLGNDTTLLQGQTLILDAGNPDCSFLWSTGATTQTILVSTAGIYSVTATNACGSDSDEIQISVQVGIGDPDADTGPVIRILNGKIVAQGRFHHQANLTVIDATGRTVSKGPADKPLEPGISGFCMVILHHGNEMISKKFILP